MDKIKINADYEQLFNNYDVVGKTITRYYPPEGGELGCLVFSDDTFALLHITYDHDESGEYNHTLKFSKKVVSFEVNYKTGDYIYDLFYFGMISEKELERVDILSDELAEINRKTTDKVLELEKLRHLVFRYEDEVRRMLTYYEEAKETVGKTV